MPSSTPSPEPVRRVKTASLPITTPCSLAPISAPHIHHGRLSSTAAVAGAWSISVHVQASRLPTSCCCAGCQVSTCASLGSRSLFLAKSTPSPARVTRVSHMATPPT